MVYSLEKCSANKAHRRKTGITLFPQPRNFSLKQTPHKTLRQPKSGYVYLF